MHAREKIELWKPMSDGDWGGYDIMTSDSFNEQAAGRRHTHSHTRETSSSSSSSSLLSSHRCLVACVSDVIEAASRSSLYAKVSAEARAINRKLSRLTSWRRRRPARRGRIVASSTGPYDWTSTNHQVPSTSTD